MELMSTCFDKLQKKTRAPIPEMILRHVTEAVSKAGKNLEFLLTINFVFRL